MGLIEFAEKFRIRHPNIPEAYYRKLVKFENLGKQDSANKNVAKTAGNVEPEVLPDPVAKVVGAVSRADPKAGQSTQEVPKLSFRRNSGAGNVWVNATKAPNDAQQERGVVNNTRIAAENAVSGMLNAIRASFRQSEVSVATSSNNEKVTTSSDTPRSSSASRGRGIAKSSRK